MDDSGINISNLDISCDLQTPTVKYRNLTRPKLSSWSSLTLLHLELIAMSIFCWLRPKPQCFISFTHSVFHLAVKSPRFIFKIYVDLNYVNHIYSCILVRVTISYLDQTGFSPNWWLAYVLVPHQSAPKITRKLLILIKGKSNFVLHLLKSLKCLPFSV